MEPRASVMLSKHCIPEPHSRALENTQECRRSAIDSAHCWCSNKEEPLSFSSSPPLVYQPQAGLNTYSNMINKIYAYKES